MAKAKQARNKRIQLIHPEVRKKAKRTGRTLAKRSKKAGKGAHKVGRKAAKGARSLFKNLEKAVKRVLKGRSRPYEYGSPGDWHDRRRMNTETDHLESLYEEAADLRSRAYEAEREGRPDSIVRILKRQAQEAQERAENYEDNLGERSW